MQTDQLSSFSYSPMLRNARMPTSFHLMNRQSNIYSSPKRQRSRSPQGILRSGIFNNYAHTAMGNTVGGNATGVGNVTSAYSVNTSPNSNNAFGNINADTMKRLLDDICMYPTGFADLLKSQDKNIKSFKMLINKQKEKVDEDLASFKIEINHTLQDLRLSLHAHLDRVYQSYLQKTSKFRSQLFQINRLKQQLQIELGSSSLAQLQAKVKQDTQGHHKNLAQRDNDPLSTNLNLKQSGGALNTNSIQSQKNHTITNMQLGNKEFKKYYVLNFIADIQRERIGILNQLQKQLVFLNNYQNGFYQSPDFLKMLAHVREILTKQTRKVYDNNHLYIRDIDGLVIRERQQQQKLQNQAQVQQTKILDGLQLKNKVGSSFIPVNQPIMNPPTQNVIITTVNPPVPINPHTSISSITPINALNPLTTTTTTVILNPNLNPNLNPSNLNLNLNPILPPSVSVPSYQLSNLTSSSLFGQISQSQQSLRTPSTSQISLTEQALSLPLPPIPPSIQLQLQTQSNQSPQQTPLCGIWINNQIVIGLKDGTIQVFSCDGLSIAVLKEHKAGICTLGVVRTRAGNLLVSGGDVGCCRVVIWDTVTWTVKGGFQGHQGAITGIVDLQDETHILSAGYDRKINIFNYQVNKLVYTAPLCQSPITAVLVNKTASKLIACGLDKAIYVWGILRDYKVKVQSIVLQRKIQNNAKISAIVASQIVPQLMVIATQDSKLKLVNISTGESYKTIPILATTQPFDSTGSNAQGSNYPLQMTIIQRESKPYYPLALVFPYKQSKIYQINTETTQVSIKNINTSICSGQLEFGYGVSPKGFYVPDLSGVNRGLHLYMINQRNQGHTGGKSCVSVFRVQEIK